MGSVECEVCVVLAGYEIRQDLPAIHRTNAIASEKGLVVPVV